MSDYSRVIIGLGKTGWSVARYFASQGFKFCVMDTRTHPTQVENFKYQFPKIPVHTGSLNQCWLQESQQIILSPGVDPKLLHHDELDIQNLVYSDIDLFGRIANAPIIAITGSNGKSTVTLLIHHLLTKAGKRVQVGGNLGIPALDLFIEPAPDFYVLELSSFQLSITKKLKTAVSVFLNFAPDHLERHTRLVDYHSAKQNIYRNCRTAVWNRDDPATYPEYVVPNTIAFGTDKPLSDSEFGLISSNLGGFLAKGSAQLIETELLTIKGTHNHLNALAALATLHAIDCPAPTQSLAQFKGLPHRLEYVCIQAGITWINDSKATNAHATHAALSSFTTQHEGKIILIVGGIYKVGDDLQSLSSLMIKYVKQLVVIGQDALIFTKNFSSVTSTYIASTLTEAIEKASNCAVSGDTILLSPACASQDMFKDYEERGDYFKQAVKKLLNLDEIL